MLLAVNANVLTTTIVNFNFTKQIMIEMIMDEDY